MQSGIASPPSSKTRNQLVDNQSKVALAIFLAVSGTATIGTACGDTVTWQWEATVYQAGFGSSQTIELPWEVSVGDTITGTFAVNYADAGVERVPGVKVYEAQPLDNVTVKLDGVEVWLDQYTTNNNIIIDDQPSFNPDLEKIDVNRFSRGDPRFPDLAVDGGMSFVAPTGADLIQDAETPTAFDLSDFSSAVFGMFIGNTEPAVQYSFGARLINLRQRSTYACVGFEAPMDAYPVAVKGRNRALPLRAQLIDSEGYLVTDQDIAAPAVQVIFSPDNNGYGYDVTEDSLPSGYGTQGNQFEFTPELTWQYNLKTGKHSAPGTYTISIVPGDAGYAIDPACITSFKRK